MEGAGADPRHLRALRTEHAMHAAAAARVVEGPYGTTFVTPDRALCHQDNLVWAAPGADAGALESASEALLPADDVVLTHDAATAAALATRGFTTIDESVMALAAAPDRVDTAGAREVPLDAVLPSWDRWLATDTPYGADPEVREQILDHHRHFGAAGAEERILAVMDGDVALAWTKLWLREGAAQIEDVVCVPEARGRGLGRGVVTAALQAARDAELVFLVAIDADWPRELYAKLGFRRVGGVVVCTRPDQSSSTIRPPA